jgi:hypothetical protein
MHGVSDGVYVNLFSKDFSLLFEDVIYSFDFYYEFFVCASTSSCCEY